MQTKKDECPCGNKPITAELIIKNFMMEAEMNYFAENLHELFLAFVRDSELPNSEFKGDVIYCYTSLRKLIHDIQLLQTQNPTK